MKNLAVVVVSIFLLQLGCSPAKRVARQQAQYQQMVDEYNKNHPPRIDTTTIYKTGADSSKFYKALADSIAGTKVKTVKEIIEKYKDTCTTAIDTYNEGFEVGYQMGVAEGKAMAPVRVDTFKKIIVPVDHIQLLQKLNQQLELKLLAEKNITVKAQSKTVSWRTAFIVSAVLNLLLIAFLTYKLFKL